MGFFHDVKRTAKYLVRVQVVAEENLARFTTKG